MARPANQSNEWNYQVVQMAIENPLNPDVPSGFFANIRKDTKHILGIATESYGIVQNHELVDVALAALEGYGLKGYEMNVIVADNGSRVYIEFTFKNKVLATAVGDRFGYRFIIKNSFDRSLRVALELAFLRLSCLNGASTLEKEFSENRKHSSRVSADFLKKAIDEAIKRGPEALKIYEKMADKSISTEKGLLALANLEHRGLLSTTVRESIETLWLTPPRKEDKARNLYNLYNAITEHLTHQVRGERYEYSQKLASGILHILVNAAVKKDQFDKLIAVPKTKSIIVPTAPVIITP